jgi:molybdopterin converting factor small subunit
MEQGGSILAMPVKVLIPTPLRQYADRHEAVEVDGHDVGEVLQQLVSAHPQLQGHLYTSEGRLRSFVNIYLNDEDIRYTGLERTPVRNSDTVSIIPSIAGGSVAAARC